VGGVTALQYAIAFVTLAILARFLVPEEFGEAVLALTVADFLMVLASLSLPAALLREQEVAFPSAFTAALALEALVLGMALILAVPIALLLGTLAGSVTSSIFLAVIGGRCFGIIANHYQAVIERRLAYGSFAIIQLGSQVVSLFAAVGVAALGGGAWALATRDIATGLASFVLAFGMARFTLRRAISRTKLRELWRFGTAMIGSRLGDLAFHRLDNLMVATFSGSGPLGLYNQAYVLAEGGNKLFASVIAYLPLNLYAKIQGQRDRVQRAYDLINFWIIRSVAPIGLVMLLLPEQLLITLFGDPWGPAAGMLRGLAVYAALLPVFEHARVLLVANGAVRAVLVARGLQLAVFIPSLVVLTWQFGGEGAGASVAMAMITGTAAILFQARRYAQMRWADWMPAVVSSAIAVAVGALVVKLVTASAALELFAGSGALIATYALSTALLERKLARQNAALLVEALRASSASASSAGAVAATEGP
jgi:O-antigen/teichoic acid export membrane protein